MKSSRYSLTNAGLLPKQNIFFDANVLIYIFWPTTPQLSSSYSTAFRNILSTKHRLYTCTHTLSEVINRCLRLEYKNHLSKNGLLDTSLSFKQYRDSVEGKSVQNDVYQIVKKQILQYIDIFDKSYNSRQVSELLVVDTLDFNDKIILKNCIENNFILFTNDQDFKNSDVDILTMNREILNS